MDWKTYLHSRLVNAETAIRAIKSNQRIYLAGNCSVPQVLVKALVDYAPELQNVEICQPLTIGRSDYIHPDLVDHLRVNSLFIGSNVRKAIQEGKADFTPVCLSEIPLLFKKGVLPLDVAIIPVSPPDENGFCTLGIEAGLSRTAAKSAKMIIAELNPHMPRTYGDTLIHASELDYMVNVDYPLAELRMKNDSDTQILQKIGMIIAEHIPDGATMQLGIGGIPESVIPYLKHKKDLGIHTELISDGVMDLVKNGLVTNYQKTIHKEKIIAGFVIGTQELYDWVDNNPEIELLPTEYVNDPFVIAQNSRMVAINSAIEVDLTGQVCADSIGTNFYSGIGGQMDFIVGASRSEGGLPIIALPSVDIAKNGYKFSKIVTTLKTGAGVTTTRNHVHYVATEYGMVDLYGKSIRQRAQAMISIAHPDFRDELLFQARKLNYI